jgi:hypothetical protein
LKVEVVVWGGTVFGKESCGSRRQRRLLVQLSIIITMVVSERIANSPFSSRTLDNRKRIDLIGCLERSLVSGPILP